MAGLVVVGVSEKYCIVICWSGKIACGMKTSIFELSKGRIKRTWVSGGGGFNFLDLKNTVESDYLLQFRPVAPA